MEFLVVADKVLDSSCNSLGINIVDVRGGNLAVHGRVFREGLEASITEGRALGVYGRRQYNVTACERMN